MLKFKKDFKKFSNIFYFSYLVFLAKTDNGLLVENNYLILEQA